MSHSAQASWLKYGPLAAGLALALSLAACSTDQSPVAPAAPTEAPVTPNAPSFYTYPSAIYRNNIEFGKPSATSTSDFNNYPLSKTQYYVSYNNSKGEGNWFSWNLNKTHFGDAARSSSFYVDPTLPTGITRISTTDYTNSGYDRGHMCRSEERTWSTADNKVAFYMTNMLPQYHDLNGGPWYKLEAYCQTQCQTYDKELYVISGGYGSRGTLNNAGKVTIPTRNWKVIVIMPYGQGLANVTSTSSLKVIAADFPNTTGIISNSWQTYQTTVDAIEAATGLNLLSSLPDAIENSVESTKATP